MPLTANSAVLGFSDVAVDMVKRSGLAGIAKIPHETSIDLPMIGRSRAE
jgi:hypothetical protein